MAGHYYNGRELELLIPASCLEVLKTAVKPLFAMSQTKRCSNSL